MISIVIISKDEPSVGTTIVEVLDQARALDETCEVVVVDASEGRLDSVRDLHGENVRWISYSQPDGVRVSIPHQRNIGVHAADGDLIVFTDAGCRPDPEWLRLLTAPLMSGEALTAGPTLATEGGSKLYDNDALAAMGAPYLLECGSGNLAFRREVFDAVGGFDESFAYGSDIDFTWRVTNSGYKIRSVPEAVNRHDWGTGRRRMRRSYVYGMARVKLYRKHGLTLVEIARRDPMVVAYPIFLVGLPLTLVFPVYPALLLIPVWRNRANGPARIIVDHLMYGAGVLAELVKK